jgi:short-subunit dehydrogenase
MNRYRRALVTGASSGLGEAFARELAAQGCQLVLVARDADALNALAATLGPAVEVLAADLGDPAGLDAVERRLAADPPVDLLVNAAGALGGIGPLALQPPDLAEQVIALNATAAVRLTRAAVRAMVARRHGGVVNVSSVNGFWPTPGGAVYSATKSFLTSFSQSVHGEVCWHGVHVTALCPGSTASKLHARAGHKGSRVGSLLEPEFVVRSGLAAVAAGRPVDVPSVEYSLKAALSRHAPWLARRYFYRRWGRPAASSLAAELTTD